MLSLLKRLLKIGSYQPLNKVIVSKDNLIFNYKYLSGLQKDIKIAPVLKSNAYGHGIAQVGQILDSIAGSEKSKDFIASLQNDKTGVPFYCVDSLYEAYQLKKAQVKTPILIMGYVSPESLKVKKLPFSYAVFDIDQAKILNKYQPGSKIHLFVDTGMNREGVKVEDLREFILQLKMLENLEIEGLMTHMAVAEDPGNSTTKKQLANFKKAQQIAHEIGIKPKWIHMGGSGAVLNFKELPCNLLRVGKALYGIGPSLSYTSLKPVLKMTTKVVQIKTISKGEKIGYDSTFTALKSMVIGILPVGYYDGIDRRLSNKGSVIVDKVECPIIGLISMNITTIDLTSVENPYVGQEVLMFSDKLDDPNCILKAAKLCGTIPYDILVHLASSTRRIVI